MNLIMFRIFIQFFILADARNREDCRHQLSRTNSHTKALAVYDKSSKLIECSNLYQVGILKNFDDKKIRLMIINKLKGLEFFFFFEI